MSFLERVDDAIRQSAAWRSLFRTAYPADERSRALAVMNNVFLHIHPVRVRQHAVKFAYTFCLGGLSFFLFLVLTITGVYLMFFYVPSATQAYTNILDIQSHVTFGLLTRNIHRWAAHLMVFFVFLHMMRVFYHGAYKPPREFNWVVGVVLLFLVLTVTGVYLMFFYVPSATQAYTNTLDIQSKVAFGLLTRNIHRWGAHLMVFFVFLHMMRVFYHGAYKPPREFNWVVGVVLLFLTIMLSFSGYLLPWDQIAYWAITIGTNMGGYAPLISTPFNRLLLGGLEVGQNTLLRFYVLHIMVLPLVGAIFLAVHFWRIRKDGGISGPL
jgi:quinol-cytochrome oxidoreductase complex cytochrome b subunit